MSVEELLDVRKRVDAAVAQRRTYLEQQLSWERAWMEQELV